MESNLLTMDELRSFLGMSRSTLYRLRSQNETFPQPVQLTRNSRKLRFFKDEV